MKVVKLNSSRLLSCKGGVTLTAMIAAATVDKSFGE